MSNFDLLQRKSHFKPVAAMPTYPSLQPSHSLLSQPPSAPEPTHPVTQTQLERATRFGHSFGRISTFPSGRKNNTGLPDTLKAGVETLSGLAMDDVQVHYHSSRPAQVQALAYTQGRDIHVGPGQEKHLPHEAWHVVQQKQGRVKSRLQAKGVTINEDRGLEREADVMGQRASQIGSGSLQNGVSRSAPVGPLSDIIQRKSLTVSEFPGITDIIVGKPVFKAPPTYISAKTDQNEEFKLRPGQDFLNDETSAKYLQDKNNIKGGPVRLLKTANQAQRGLTDNDKVISDGHHRFIFSAFHGDPIPFENKIGFLGGHEWKDLTWQKRK